MIQGSWSSTYAKTGGSSSHRYSLTDPQPVIRKDKTSCCVLVIDKHSDCDHQLGNIIWAFILESFKKKDAVRQSLPNAGDARPRQESATLLVAAASENGQIAKPYFPIDFF